MCRNFKFKNKILFIFITIFVVIVLMFSGTLYYYSSNTVLDIRHRYLQSSAGDISAQIDTVFRSVNNASIAFTMDRSNIELIMDLYNNPDDENFYMKKTKLSKNLSTIYTIINDIYNVVIFLPDHNKFFTYLKQNENLINNPCNLYTDDTAEDLIKSKRGAHLDDWSEDPGIVFSSIDTFKTMYSRKLGYLELQIPYKKIEKICKSKESSFEVYIFDDQGNMMYPYIDDEDEIIEKNRYYGLASNDYKDYKRKNYMLASYTSDYMGWNTVIVDKSNYSMNKIKLNTVIIFAFSLVLLLFTVFIYNFLIKKLTLPLRLLTNKIENISLENLSLQVNSQDLDEFAMLDKSFEMMFARLRHAINNEYEAKVRDFQSLYQSMQSQINPHFLYNTLSILSIKCEEGDGMDASRMCLELADMMQYTASSPNALGNISTEINHARNYLNLFSNHYEENLSYVIDVPDKMHNIKIPKCIIQPIVENSITHGLENILPPWEISIIGHCTDDKWTIKIYDNGCGFDEQKLLELKDKIKEYEKNILDYNLTNNLNIGGLGLLNTYARLKIHFGDNLFFDISRPKSRGTLIIFGCYFDGEF
ncbi:sensor histidine kinase [Vallitalea guaymasensis]|uniref:sensor histidine kinase n=1 Tax=Vallitalea guaymasensis TaxID=1185412 RepID=UPI000DE26FEF|nr:histidine kinase [Vallitalea guaymasensis]